MRYRAAWLRRTLVPGAALVLVLALLALAPAPAGGQESTPTATETAQATATPAPTATAAGTPSPDATAGGRDTRWVAVATLLAGLTAMGAILLYLRHVQGGYYALVGQSIRALGTVPMSSAVAPFGRAEEAVEAPLIEGPEVVEARRPAEFRVAVGGTEVVADWTVEPGDAAEIVPARAATVQVTATKVGKFTLVATPTAGGMPGRLEVAAVAAAERVAAIPFVGAGYGSVLLAILLVTVAAVLGILDVLHSEALAAFFGAVAGYVFLRTGAVSGGGGEDNAPARDRQ